MLHAVPSNQQNQISFEDHYEQKFPDDEDRFHQFRCFLVEKIGFMLGY
jgi:hypothetical protein